MPKQSHLSLGEKLKRSRQAAGLSQRELGEHLRLSDKAVSTYEVGRAEPSFKTIQKISKLVRRPVTYFLDDIDTHETDLGSKLKQIEKELKEIKVLLKASK